MPVDYELRVSDPTGAPLFRTRSFLETGPLPGLSYTLNVGNVGSLVVTLPPEYNNVLTKDTRIGVWRSVNGAPAQLEGGSVFLARKWDYAENFTVLTAVHANHILSGRCMLYPLSSGYGVIGVATPADDIIKDLWRLNFGTSIDTAQRATTTGGGSGDNTYADISASVSIEADESAAPSIYKTVAWRNLLDIIVELCESSYQAGTYLAAEIIAPSESTLELQTFAGQRGQDRRFSSGGNLLFSAARGNLENAILTVDAINEVTFAQAGGAGISTGVRYLATAIDGPRAGATPFGRRELFVDDSNTQDVNALTSMANSAVIAGRPVVQAVGGLVETDTCIRGVHYNFGDLVTVEVQGQQYDMHLDILEVHVSGGQSSDDVSGDLRAVDTADPALRVMRQGDTTRGYFVQHG